MSTITALASVRGRARAGMTAVVAIVVPSILAWTLLTWLAFHLPRLATVVAVFGYMATYAVVETLMLPVRSPELQWEVPLAWVEHRRPQTALLIWGGVLGPGLATRNQFAGFWAAPALIALVPSASQAALIGAIAGAAHGLSRGAGILLNRRTLGRSGGDPFSLMASRIALRVGDGVLLAFTVTLLLACVLRTGLGQT